MVLGMAIGLVAGVVLGACVLPLLRARLGRALVDLGEAEQVEPPPGERRTHGGDGHGPSIQGRTWT